MESKEQFDNLILRYLSNQTEGEEEASVVAWINADDSNRKYFEELKRTWRLTSLNRTMEQIDVDVEWNRFKDTIAAKQTKIVPIDEGQTFNEGVANLPNRRRPVYKMFILVATAASLLLMLALRLNWFSNPKPRQQEIVKADTNNNDTRPYAVHHEINSSGKEKKIVLEDGSEVLLADESELSYTVPFALNKRDISLRGRANFKVAKDKYRPFTVFSGDIATTALGTQFIITNYVKDDNIIVRLFEGKVVIKSIEKANLKMQQDYYLLPGNELIYHKQSSTASLRTFGHEKLVNKPQEDVVTSKVNHDDPSVPKNQKGSWYMFNNQPLSEVFDQLGSMYKVEITYSKKELANIYFIGSFEKTDSIEKILNKIAITNNLKITKSKEGNKYSLHK